MYWGEARAHQPGRLLADAECANRGLADSADEVVSQCEVCQAFDGARRPPAAGT